MGHLRVGAAVRRSHRGVVRGPVIRTPGGRATAPAGRLRPVQGRRGRDPPAVPQLYQQRRRALRHRPLDPRRDRRDRDPPRHAPPPPASAPASTRYGCCAGPMQFSIVGSPSTWAATASTATATAAAPPTTPRTRSPPPPATCAPAAPPPTTARAIFAYNHADWYVAEVLAQAAAYRGAAIVTAGSPGETASIRDLLANPRIVLSPASASTSVPAASTRGCSTRSVDRPPPHLSSSRPCGPTTTRGTQPRGRPRHGHRRRRRRDLPRRPFGACADLVRELAAVDRPARARRSSSTAGTLTARSTRAVSRAPTTATTSTGAWTRDAATRRP